MRQILRAVIFGTEPLRPSSLSWRRPIYIATVTAALIALAILLGMPAAAISIAVGSIFAGLGAIGEPVGHRWRIMLWTTLWVSLAATVGGLLSTLDIAEVVAVAGISAVCGFAGALGQRAALIGVVTLVTFTIYAGTPATTLGEVETGALVGLGGFIQIAFTVIPVLVRNRRVLHGREDGLATIRARFRPHFTKEDLFLRHAARLTVAMTVATILGLASNWPLEYWIPMTVAWLSRPNADGVATRVLSRIVGTLVGIALAIGLIWGLNLGAPAIPVIVGFGTVAMLVFLRADYTIAVAGVTLLVLSLFTLINEELTSTVPFRVAATLVAGVIVILASLLWPSKVAIA